MHRNAVSSKLNFLQKIQYNKDQVTLYCNYGTIIALVQFFFFFFYIYISVNLMFLLR